jgi:hypothetical protein
MYIKEEVKVKQYPYKPGQALTDTGVPDSQSF